MNLKNFKISEFDSPDLKGSGGKMQENTLLMLDKARDFAGVPFKITSGFRTEAHNKKSGGERNSAHLRGFAADISTPNSAVRLQVIRGLIEAGFTRIGIGKTFVHADNDPSLPQDVLFHYY